MTRFSDVVSERRIDHDGNTCSYADSAKQTRLASAHASPAAKLRVEAELRRHRQSASKVSQLTLDQLKRPQMECWVYSESASASFLPADEQLLGKVFPVQIPSVLQPNVLQPNVLQHKTNAENFPALENAASSSADHHR